MDQQPEYQVLKTVERSVIGELDLFGLAVSLFDLAVFRQIIEALVSNLLIYRLNGVVSVLGRDPERCVCGKASHQVEVRSDPAQHQSSHPSHGAAVMQMNGFFGENVGVL